MKHRGRSSRRDVQFLPDGLVGTVEVPGGFNVVNVSTQEIVVVVFFGFFSLALEPRLIHLINVTPFVPGLTEILPHRIPYARNSGLHEIRPGCLGPGNIHLVDLFPHTNTGLFSRVIRNLSRHPPCQPRYHGVQQVEEFVDAFHIVHGVEDPLCYQIVFPRKERRLLFC